MRQQRQYGSVRGAIRDGRPYRDPKSVTFIPPGLWGRPARLAAGAPRAYS